MDKTFLEKTIKQRAAARLETEWYNTFKLMDSSPILKRLKINLEGVDINLITDTQLEALFKRNKEASVISKHSNLKTILAELLDDYEKEEVENLLKKLENIQYLFQQNNL